MNVRLLKNLAAVCASATLAILLPACAHQPPEKKAGCVVRPYTLTRVPNAAPGIGEIDVVYDTPADQAHPTLWRVSGFDEPGKWRKVNRPAVSDPAKMRAMTYVVEFASADGKVLPPVIRTIEILEEQRLTLRVTYSRKPGAKDCQ